MALSLALMVLDHRGAHVAGLRKIIATAVSPVFYIASAPADLYKWFAESFQSRDALLRENRRLQDEQFSYRTQLQRLVALESENARLRALLQSARKIRGERKVAEVISVDLDAREQQILVNLGSDDGIFVGQVVLDAFGVMGQVVEVTGQHARVLLLTSSRHALPVRVERTGFNAIAQGTGSLNRLRLAFVPNTTDIREGDLLVSSGMGERFPDGYPVGEVVAINRDPSEPYAEIDVVTAARMERSGEVLLIWPAKNWLPGSEAAAPEAGAADARASEAHASGTRTNDMRTAPTGAMATGTEAPGHAPTTTPAHTGAEVAR